MLLSRMMRVPLPKLIAENSGLRFLSRFLILFVFFYYVNIAAIAITSEGGLYWQFADKYLDYISFWRYSLLKFSSIIANLVGFDTQMVGPYKLKLAGETHMVSMVYSCIGYGVTSVWLAFTLAMEFGWKKKLFWLVIGSCGLFILNCFRIVAILLAHDRLGENALFDHHTLFNIVAYGFVFLLMYLIIQANEKTNKNKTVDSV